ncbi:MAG: hypothetical protein ABIJ56_24590 [Pseudomonadota bacterium]
MTTAPGKIRANFGDFLMWLSDRYWSPQIICGRIDFNGPVDEQRLLAAWERLCFRIPVLRSVLRLFDGEGFFEVLEPGDLKRFLTVVHDQSGQRAAADEHRFVTRAIDAETAAPVRMWLHHRPGGDRLVVKVHHTSFDGSGFKSALAVLADCYRAGTAGCPPREESVLPVERSEEQVFGKTGPGRELVLLGRAALSMAAKRSVMGDNAIWTDRPAPTARRGAIQPRLRQITLEPGCFEQFYGYCKSRGATVNEGLLAALDVAVAGWNAAHGLLRDVYPLGFTADMRRMAPELAGEPVKGIFCNLSSAEAVAMPASRLTDLSSALESLLPELGEMKRRHMGAAGVFAFRKMTLGLPPRVARHWMTPLARRVVRGLQRSFTLTNMGIIPDEAGDYDEIKARAMSMWAPVFPAPQMYMSATSYGGALTLTPSYDGAGLSEEAADEFEAVLRQVLDEAKM